MIIIIFLIVMLLITIAGCIYINNSINGLWLGVAEIFISIFCCIMFIITVLVSLIIFTIK